MNRNSMTLIPGNNPLQNEFGTLDLDRAVDRKSNYGGINVIE